MNIPPNTTLLPDCNDSGKRVRINSVGGFFDGDLGTVLYGPFKYPYTIRIKLPRRKGHPQMYREEARVSVPQYYVMVDKWRRAFSFLEPEVTVLQESWHPDGCGI